jgi:predicted HicB family RNase H-like nuclease
MNTMNYKGYIACIEYSEEDEEFVGSIVNTSRDEIYFGGGNVEELKKNMRHAVDGHIENCKELGINPEKPYSGRLTYRTTPEQHAKLMKAALTSGKRSINAWIDEVLRRETDKVLSTHINP